MYYVYILENLSGNHYIGATSDLSRRLHKHNTGGSTWTRKRGPWKMIYSEELNNKYEALRREKQLKRYKGGQALINLIKLPR